ncbi:permease-like cell division protein FtsX [Acidiferrobacter thiooxydans]|uniref:permease-like cell division protein FtsX n=1 Tax=Acidiferrobacter thiooxydans TaxID=163359 RepID=UPI002264CD7B|nr:permease-like cell division protein FtsX [Acidiferrobacter thiooxydans]UEO00142.1 permease-like cell division protein FtsX [Acidiferrobacter thiooxydans]
MKAYLTRHMQVFMRTLGDFARSPAATFLTVVMIGVTLVLPTGLYVGLLNLQRLTPGLQPRGSLSVYLTKGVSNTATIAAIRRIPGIAAVRYISPAEGLREFSAASGLGTTAVAFRHHNPLPGVAVVTPAGDTPASVARLAAQLKVVPGVAHVQSNLAWVERLDAALALGHRLVVILAVALGLALILIIGNTTRAAVASRADEIAVVSLVGGTNAFIRRPFLYAGALTGGLGALCALILLETAFLALDGPVAALDRAYGAHYQLMGPDLGQALGLLGVGALLGWLGARIAVGQALRSHRI